MPDCFQFKAGLELLGDTRQATASDPGAHVTSSVKQDEGVAFSLMGWGPAG